MGLLQKTDDVIGIILSQMLGLGCHIKGNGRYQPNGIPIWVKHSNNKLKYTFSWFYVFLFSIFVSSPVHAVNITLDNTISKINGDNSLTTCVTGDIYRLGTTASYNGQNIDLLIEITAEDNQYDQTDLAPGNCVAVGNGILEARLRNIGAGTRAYMDLKVSVVTQGTLTPLSVDRITFSAFDLDKNNQNDPNSIYYTLTDDLYMISPSRAYKEGNGASNVSYSEGVFGSGYDVKLQGQTTGNCNDNALNPDAECRGGGIAVYSDTGAANQVSFVNIRVKNDNAYGNTDVDDGYFHRLIQLSFKELDFNAILNQSEDHGDAPLDYQDASHQISVFTVLGSGFPADEENSQYSVNADSDDNSNTGNISFDDEDGVRINGQPTVGSLLDMTVGRSYNIDVTSIGNGYLSAWLDLDGDKDFTSPGEKILDDTPISSTVAIDTSILVNIPSSNYTGVSYARFRFSKNPNVGPDGFGGEGEVEDYKVIFNPGGDIVGHLYNDINANGSQDSGEPDLANVSIVVTDTPGTMTTMRTNGNGHYRAETIRTGVASVSVTMSTLPAGAIQTEGSNPTNVTVNADVDNMEENNGFYFPATVSGSVKDASNAAIAGVTLHIKDSSDNIINDTNSVVLTTVTNTAGAYTFSNVPAGNYDIVEEDPNGYLSLQEGDSSADGDINPNTNTNNNKIPITITSAKVDTDNDFIDELIHPIYTMENSADMASISAPGTITYTFGFVNTGNVELTNLTVSDANIDAGTLSGCPIASLAVGTSQSCSATRLISQLQINLGEALINTAIPSATGPDGTTVVQEDNTANDNSTSTSVTRGYTVEGRIYNDIDTNGINDVAEKGISGLPVVLMDTINNTCISTRTDGKGYYQFLQVEAGSYQVYEASRATIPAPVTCSTASAKDPAGYRSTTDNISAPFNVVNANLSDINFGDVNNPTFSPDHSKTVLSGKVELYTHTFVSASNGLVSFEGVNSVPVSTGWTSVIYLDSDCNGQINGAENNTPVTLVPALANTPICIINTVFTPSNVAANDNYRNIISADFDFNSNPYTGTAQLKVTDNSQVSAHDPSYGSSKLVLRKTVQNLDIFPLPEETETQNQAKPGQKLRYRVYYHNAGTGPITDLVLNDRVPEFTTLDNLADCNVGLAAGLTSCVVSQNGSDIEWTFGPSDVLKSGQKGVVIFDVIID